MDSQDISALIPGVNMRKPGTAHQVAPCFRGAFRYKYGETDGQNLGMQRGL